MLIQVRQSDLLITWTELKTSVLVKLVETFQTTTPDPTLIRNFNFLCDRLSQLQLEILIYDTSLCTVKNTRNPFSDINIASRH